MVLFAQAGSDDRQPSLRPGVPDRLKLAAEGAFDVLVVADSDMLRCSQPELEGLLASLLPYNIHTFSAKGGHWVEPGGRRWMVLPGYDEEELPEVDVHE